MGQLIKPKILINNYTMIVDWCKSFTIETTRVSYSTSLQIYES